MTQPYSVHINSAGRADTLCSKTLPLLLNGGVDPESITVWLPDDNELHNYRKALSTHGLFVNLDIAPHDPGDRSLAFVGIEPINLGRARNHVIETVGPRQQVLFIDDDLTGISRATGPKTLEPIRDVDRFFRSAFRDADAAAVTLWGIYPVDNPYFMKRRHNLKLTYCPGGLFGLMTTGGQHERVVLDDKEDYERSIRHYLHAGRVLRLEDVCMGTTGYSGSGGMQISRTPERVRRSARWLVETFPGLASINLSKKSGWVEVRLRDVRPARPATR